MIKKTINYFSYQLITSLIGLISIPYLTRTLLPEDFGYIGLMQVLIFLLVPIFGFQSYSLIGINKVKYDPLNYNLFKNTLITFNLLIIFFSSICITIISFFYFRENFILVILSLFIASFRYVITIHNQELVQEEKVNEYGILNSSTQLLILVFSILFLSMFHMSWEGRLLAILIVELIISLIRVLFFSNLLNRFNLIIDKKHLKTIIVFGSPLFIALCASWVTFQSDKLIVLKLFSIEAAGYYTVAYSIASFINNINQSVRNAYVPQLRLKLNEGNAKIFILKFQLFYSIFILLLASLISLIFYNYEILILGENYEGIWKIIVSIIFAYSIFGIYSSFGPVLEFFGLTKLKTNIVVIGAFLKLILIFYLLKPFGYIAPGLGTLFSFSIILIITYYVVFKELGKRGIK